MVFAVQWNSGGRDSSETTECGDRNFEREDRFWSGKGDNAPRSGEGIRRMKQFNSAIDVVTIQSAPLRASHTSEDACGTFDAGFEWRRR
jgi:hypothetical protein